MDRRRRIRPRGCPAFVNRRGGRVVFVGEGIDEDVPDDLNDLDDESIWIAVLDQWRAYEQAAAEEALAQWGVENGFEPSPPAAD